MRKIERQLKERLNSGPSHVVNIIQPMQEKFNKYWEKMKDFASLNKAFDPCCKLERISFTLSEELGNIEAKSQVGQIKSKLLCWFNEMMTSLHKTNDASPKGGQSKKQTTSESVEDDEDMRYKKHLAKKQATQAELDLYLQLPRTTCDKQLQSILGPQLVEDA
jgi:hypothetical protein